MNFLKFVFIVMILFFISSVSNGWRHADIINAETMRYKQIRTDGIYYESNVKTGHNRYFFKFYNDSIVVGTAIEPGSRFDNISHATSILDEAYIVGRSGYTNLLSINRRYKISSNVSHMNTFEVVRSRYKINNNKIVFNAGDKIKIVCYIVDSGLEVELPKYLRENLFFMKFNSDSTSSSK